LVCGGALLVDYVLTIAISIASGADAVFNLLPLQYHQFKLAVTALAICLLIILNLRGVRESVVVLCHSLVFLVTRSL
jgi:amino acid transporter